MDGQLILGIVVAVLALFGPMFWFGYRQGMMNAELKSLNEEVKDMKKALYRRGIAELASKEGWGYIEP